MILAEAVNLTSTDWVIISSLATVIVAMALFFTKFIIKIFKLQEEERKNQSEILHGLHETHRVEQKENLTSMITAMAGSTKALENNTKVMDEMKGLINSVRDEIIKKS